MPVQHASLRRYVLLVHTGALGDFLVSWPLALAMSRVFAQNRIVYVTHEQKGRLVEKLADLEWQDIDATWGGLSTLPNDLPEAASGRIRQAHTVLSFVHDASDPWMQQTLELSQGANLLSLRTKPPADWDRHATDWLVDQLDVWDAMAQATSQMIASINSRGLNGRAPVDGPITLLPGSGSRDKCWPVAAYVDLAARLQSDGRDVQFVLGEVERERFDDTERDALARQAQVLEPQTLVALADVFGGSSGVIANDSGPTHLAGMMGLPVLALFGPTSSVVWKPMGPRVQTIDADLTTLAPDEVYQKWKDCLTSGAG